MLHGSEEFSELCLVCVAVFTSVLAKRIRNAYAGLHDGEGAGYGDGQRVGAGVWCWGLLLGGWSWGLVQGTDAGLWCWRLVHGFE